VLLVFPHFFSLSDFPPLLIVEVWDERDVLSFFFSFPVLFFSFFLGHRLAAVSVSFFSSLCSLPPPPPWEQSSVTWDVEVFLPFSLFFPPISFFFREVFSESSGCSFLPLSKLFYAFLSLSPPPPLPPYSFGVLYPALLSGVLEHCL